MPSIPPAFVVAVLAFGFAAPALAIDPPACAPAIAAAERARGTPPGLLAAIGLVESGRLDPRTGQRSPWPWTVTANGVGTFYPGKSAAIDAVEALRSRGVTSIDVGCMQVNLLYHPTAFRSLADAFEPAANTLYAAGFLTVLYRRLNDWPRAAAAYHSFTPALGAQYGQLVSAVWSGAPVPTMAGPGGVEIVRFPGGGQMRILRDEIQGYPGRVAGFLTAP